MKISIPLSLAIIGALATPALAQDNPADFNGAYVTVGVGRIARSNDAKEALVFDTNRDGTFGDKITTTAGANVFSPGFCGGEATVTANRNCRNDKDGLEYFLRTGYDRRIGNIVLGVVLEGGRGTTRDSVSAFSTAPASYTISREADWRASARLRAGYTPGGGALFYVTGGGSYARLDNKFTTTNKVNSFSGEGKSNAWGYSAGGGAEIMVIRNLALGLEYIFTDVKDQDYLVKIGAGNAPSTDPFLRGSSGTDVRRSDPHFLTHSIRGTLSLRF